MLDIYIRKNVEKTHMHDRASVIQSDCTTYLKRARNDIPFSLIFIDPPYAAHMVPEMLQLILERGLASSDAIVVCESEEEDIFEGDEQLRSQFKIRRIHRYAKAIVTILERNHDEKVEI